MYDVLASSIENPSPGCGIVSGAGTNSDPHFGEAMVSTGLNGVGKLIPVPIPVGSSEFTVGKASTVDNSKFVYVGCELTDRKSKESSGCTGTAP